MFYINKFKNTFLKFRIRNLQLLVATDVAARGLDVNDLTHVIHYGLRAATSVATRSWRLRMRNFCIT